jgi:acetyl-CoA carboxylase biotin carboxylase subunit
MEKIGDKSAARRLAEEADVPVVPGTEGNATPDEAMEKAGEIGYPVMVKAAAGGGGIGMSAVADEAELRTAFDTARTRAERFFGSPAVFLERYVAHARHVEVQVLGLVDGRVLALGERDCSVQRRHQKVAEETPSPGITPQLRAAMLAAAVRAAEAVDYRGAGTVECLLDVDTGEFMFLEMNTRLQVEHPVTELVTGVDLVEEQLRVAAGDPPALDPDAPPAPRGHALELRVYAEDPKRFLPGPGTITRWEEPVGDGIRVDAGYAAGDTVTPFYDPLMAKLCIWGPDRPATLERAAAALAGFVVEGPKCNLPFFTELLAEPDFVSGRYDTGLVARLRA